MDVWKEHVEPKSGRPYWFNTATRETTWKKPPEVQRVSSKKPPEVQRVSSNGGTSAAAAVAEPGSIGRGCNPHNAATDEYIEKVIALQPTLRRPN